MVKNFSSAGGGPLSSSTHPRGGGERGGGGGPVISVFEGINRWISEDFSISNTNNNTQQQREKYPRTTNDLEKEHHRRYMPPLKAFGVALVSALAGASVVHNLYKPDLTIPGYENEEEEEKK